jgi:hypothetical protein
MLKAIRLILSLGLILGQLALAPTASADSLDLCRVPASTSQTVSLGFPFRPERLVFLGKVKILVIPFKQKDNSNYVFTEEYKRDYQAAARNIMEFSGGKTQIEYVFAPTVLTELTNADMDQLKINQQLQWQKDETKSTWGFIRKFISDQDAQIDYTGINAVILEGSSTSAYSDIAEAMMMFYEKQAGSWFRQIQTAEGLISNVVLMDNHSSPATITHEIMHLYGLQDLYGTSTGPGRLSLMASNELNLLTYEKWVLGWHPDSEVKCLNNVLSSSISQFTLDYSKLNQLAVIRAASGSIYIVETTKIGSNRYLAFYSLDNEARPPLKFFQRTSNNDSQGVLINNYDAIGTEISSPEFTLVVSDLNTSAITFNLVSSSMTATTKYTEIVAKATESKSKAKQEIELKAAADLKAKQEAELKAAADLKAKQEAELKAAADLKAKQEAEAAVKAATSVKKKTMTCVKGKISKKVTALNPKCPSGYKKR